MLQWIPLLQLQRVSFCGVAMDTAMSTAKDECCGVTMDTVTAITKGCCSVKMNTAVGIAKGELLYIYQIHICTFITFKE